MRHLNPALFAVGELNRIHYALGLHPSQERRLAGPPLDNRLDKFEILVVTEDLERVALVRVARRTGYL